MNDNEQGLLLDRKYTCPICDSKITAKGVKTNSARFVETKSDLRPIYSNINVTKYDTICCNHCGYAALTKDFPHTNSVQRKLIREKITANFTPHDEIICDTYSTEFAITRLKMALLCSVSKGAKNGEIGNICLKISWLYQDLAENIPDEAPNAAESKKAFLDEAKHAALNAYNRLTQARMQEDFPIAGMSETTLDYLLAYFAYKNGEYQQAMHYLSGVITSRSTTPRLKEKSLELKDLVSAKLHATEAVAETA